MTWSWARLLRRLRRDDSGATMIEAAIVLPLLLAITFGTVEFGMVFWQWNMAEKATQKAAEYASTSDPVAQALSSYDAIVVKGLRLGERVTTSAHRDFKITCTDAACQCVGDCAFLGGDIAHDSVAFQAILAQAQRFFPQIGTQNLVIAYTHVGQGTAGRAGGDIIPLITVSLRNMNYQFLLMQMFGFNSVQMPAFATSVMGEDMSSTYTRFAS